MLEQKSCGAVVFLKQDGQIKYLLLRYSNSNWDFMKGGAESNETEKETAIRELREETGITQAEFIDGYRKSIEYHYRRQNNIVHKVVVYFIIQTDSEIVKISFEHQGYTWLDYNNAKKKLSFDSSKKVLDDVYNFLVNNQIAKA